MRIVFVLRHSGFVRNFDTALRLLAKAGHQIEIVFMIHRPDAELAEKMAADYPNVSFGYGPSRSGRWTTLAHTLRFGLDYFRYLAPVYRDATKLRARGARGVPPWLLRFTELPLVRSRVGIALLAALFRALDRALPTDPEIDRLLEERQPDLVMVTPLVAGPDQVDYVRSARRLGIRTALPVTSWDNLTNKGLMLTVPDRVIVWNEAQRTEAIELHGAPPRDVVAVGAHTYDHWFEWGPPTSRGDFCARVGFSDDRPYVLYLCSSGFIVSDEVAVIRRWLEALRGSAHPELAECNVLVRPHPSSPALWETNPLDGTPHLSVWPRRAVDPRDEDKKQEYYDSIYHSAAVVGVNTSALIESAIVGRKSYTWTVPELRDTQEGTLHFHHLVEQNGGPLSVAETPEEHAAQLAAALREPAPRDWSTPFLESFVRPHGLGEAGAPLFVAEVEQLLAAPAPAAEKTTIVTWVLRALLRPAAVLTWPPRRGRHAMWSTLSKDERKRAAAARAVTSRNGAQSAKASVRVRAKEHGKIGRPNKLPKAAKRKAEKPTKPGKRVAVAASPRKPRKSRPLRTTRRASRRAFYRTIHLLVPAGLRARVHSRTPVAEAVAPDGAPIVNERTSVETRAQEGAERAVEARSA